MRVLVFLVFLAGCSGGLGAITGALTGGGPNVAANTQIGKENVQGVSQDVSGTQAIISVQPAARPTNAETIVNNNEAPVWVWLLALIGWILPSPSEIARTFTGWFKRKDPV